MTDADIATCGVDTRSEEAPDPRGCAGVCACSETQAAGLPELDARAIPQAIRHAAIFGALDGVAPGDGLVPVAPHDPVGLLVQLQQRAPHSFDVEYIESGPEAWRLSLIRQEA